MSISLSRAGSVTETQLVEALQPFRGFVVASLLHLFLESGLYEAIAEGPSSPAALIDGLELEPERLDAVLWFLAAEGFVVFDGDSVSATARAHEVATCRAWYQMMVGGYAHTFLQMGDALRRGSAPAHRDGAWVARGSGGISLHDSLPIVHRLLDIAGRDHRLLLDLGCGSGVYLTELCRADPALRAIGVEPDAGACTAARLYVEGEQMSDRIDIMHADAVKLLETGEITADLVILCFVMHEVLGQAGEGGVRRLLSAVFENTPDADLIIVDIDHRVGPGAHMDHPLGLAYYNAYFLLHPFTQQRLEPKEFWERMYESCGGEVVASLSTDTELDSTGFEIGWLLRRAAA